MSVVLVIGHRARRGGVPTHLGHLARALPGRGFEPVFAIPRAAEYREDLEALGARLVELEHPGKLSLGAPRRVAAIVRETGAAVVHTHARPLDLWAGLGARVARVPAVATLHAEPARAPDGSTRPGLRGRAHGLALAKLHARTIVVARAFKELARARLGTDPARTVVVENGVDLEAFATTPEKRDRARALLGAAPGEVSVGCIARFVDRGSVEKGQPDLARALVSSSTTWVLHFIGEGASEAEVKALARELGVSDRVRFHGARRSAEVIAGFDVLALASRSEGCPYAVLEALAASVPVVATRTGGLPEVLDEGRAGLLVEPGDVPALARAIDSLARDTTRRRELTERGLERARARYSLERFASETASVYRDAIGDTGRS